MQPLFGKVSSSDLASIPLTGSIVVMILPPGYPVYLGAYAAVLAAFLALLVYGWSERATFRHPASLAIIAGIALVALSVPFVYRSAHDMLAPVLILPVVASVALGLLARPAKWVPNPTVFALICLAGALLAFLGGAYAHYVLDIARPGLGNNPIHYSSLAAVAGCLALVGVVASASPWRYAFFLGPLFAMATAVIAGSRGPLAGVLAMTAVGAAVMAVWLWRENWFRVALLTILAVGATYLLTNNESRIFGILHSGMDIFRFTGGPDDIRAALYISAVATLRESPMVGVGLGQIMDMANTLFPQLVPVHNLENLHADWANFAAMGGSLGLLAWALLLSAPLLLLTNLRARQDRPIVLGAILLFVGQFTLGISNATFGILPQTTVYAVSLGYFFCRARRLALSNTALE